MSDRKTPYKFGNRIGPDMVAVVRKFPGRVRVRYKDNWYRLVTCSGCKEKYWRRYGATSTSMLSDKMPKQYCTDACARENERLLRNARQIRFRENLSGEAKRARKEYYRLKYRRSTARRKRA